MESCKLIDKKIIRNLLNSMSKMYRLLKQMIDTQNIVDPKRPLIIRNNLIYV